jgi:hypothetical protein
MGAKEIKEEIKKLELTQKLENFIWVNNQINVAEFCSRVGMYRSLDNPLRVTTTEKHCLTA